MNDTASILSPVAEASKQLDIRCETTRRLLARVDNEGLWLFCKHHNKQHLLSWKQIERLRVEPQSSEMVS